jgi:hypothetical protein
MSMTMKSIWAGMAIAALAACSPPVENGSTDEVSSAAHGAPEATRFTVLVGGTEIGGMDIQPTEDGYGIEFEYRNNGRGPTITESVTLDENGLPVDWTISGASTFGNPIDESFEYVDSEGHSRW